MMYSAIDTIWILFGAVLVFFMQAGFAMLETGFTRAKNAGHIVLKNLMDFAIGSLVFYIVGFGIMYGKSCGGIIGVPDHFYSWRLFCFVSLGSLCAFFKWCFAELRQQLFPEQWLNAPSSFLMSPIL